MGQPYTLAIKCLPPTVGSQLDWLRIFFPYLALGFWNSGAPCGSAGWDPMAVFLAPPGCSGPPDREPEMLHTVKER